MYLQLNISPEVKLSGQQSLKSTMRIYPTDCSWSTYSFLCLLALLRQRVFSCLKRLKSDFCSKLNDNTACVEPADYPDAYVDIKRYDPTEAIHLWNKSTRRPNTMPYGRKRSSDYPDYCTDDGCSDAEVFLKQSRIRQNGFSYRIIKHWNKLPHPSLQHP